MKRRIDGSISVPLGNLSRLRMRFPSAFCRTVARVPSKTVASVLRCDAWKNARCNVVRSHFLAGVARSRDVTCSYMLRHCEDLKFHYCQFLKYISKIQYCIKYFAEDLSYILVL